MVGTIITCTMWLLLAILSLAYSFMDMRANDNTTVFSSYLHSSLVFVMVFKTKT